MSTRTTLRDMVDRYVRDHALGQPLADYLKDRRDEGRTWKEIADHLAEATDGVIVVSWETLRQWSLVDGVAA